MIAVLFVSFILGHQSPSVSSSENICQGIQRHRNALLLPKPPSCGPIKPTTRIMGGSNAAVGEFPWMVLLKIPLNPKQSLQCGGSVISKRYILTAAHCFEQYNSNTSRAITVILGAHGKADKRAISMSTRDIAIHEEYNRVTAVNDIALIQLTADIMYNELIYPICLPLSCELLNEPLNSKFFIVAGWGIKQKEPQTIDAYSLQKLAVRCVDTEVCKKAFRQTRFTVTDKHICTKGAYKFPQGTCPGDSGGADMRTSGGATYQVGVVSWGDVCNSKRKDQLNIATRVSSYMLWILDHISE